MNTQSGWPLIRHHMCTSSIAPVTRALVIIRIESFENRNYNEKAALSFLKKRLTLSRVRDQEFLFAALFVRVKLNIQIVVWMQTPMPKFE